MPWLESLPGQVVQLLNNGLLNECSLLLDIMVAAAPVGIMNFGVALQDSVLAMIGEQCQVSATVSSCVLLHVCVIRMLMLAHHVFIIYCLSYIYALVTLFAHALCLELNFGYTST